MPLSGKMCFAGRILLTGKSVNGFVPYQLEYGLEQVAPVMSFYDEPTEPAPCACPNPETCLYAYSCSDPCTDISNCKHPGLCSAPQCTLAKQFINEKSSGPLQQNGITPLPAVTENERRMQYEKYMREHGFGAEQTGSYVAMDTKESTVLLTGNLSSAAQKLSAVSQSEISHAKTSEHLTGKGNEPLPVPSSKPEETGSNPAIPAGKKVAHVSGNTPPAQSGLPEKSEPEKPHGKPAKKQQFPYPYSHHKKKRKY